MQGAPLAACPALGKKGEIVRKSLDRGACEEVVIMIITHRQIIHTTYHYTIVYTRTEQASETRLHPVTGRLAIEILNQNKLLHQNRISSRIKVSSESIIHHDIHHIIHHVIHQNKDFREKIGLFSKRNKFNMN